MIVIRKKTIFNCLILFSICFISYSLIKSNNKEQQVVALPVSNKVIVIDAGHRRRRSEVQYQKRGYQKQI